MEPKKDKTEKQETEGLTLLGSQKTEYKTDSPHPGMLEHFANPDVTSAFVVVHEFKEFTSLCPKTGQPDFATITISYTPRLRCVETKSLKLYYFAYRNTGAFMEKIVNRIRDDMVLVLDPIWLEVVGEFRSRGGIKTKVVADHEPE